MRQLLNEMIILMIFLFSSSVLANETVLEVIPLQHRPASELQPLIGPLLEATDQVLDNGDSLIVRTTSERLSSILSLVKKLDIALSNLAITVIQSSRQTASDLNAAAAINVNIPLDQPHHANEGMRGHIASTELLKERESTQIIRTLEGRPAYIKTGQAHPINTISFFNSGYGYPAISTDTQFIEATTGFVIVPRLSRQQVILEVSPWSDTINRRGNIETHSAHTSLQAKLGEWVEIGSIEQGKQQGYLKHSRSTQQQTLRILIKVDKFD